MSDHQGKVAMIGLDAADLDFIQANIASLPNLRRFLKSGITRKLSSTAGALTGSVWPTFNTGKTPGDHGIYHHLQWDSSRMQLRRVSEDWLYCEPFWYELERRGLRVVALDVPMTFRPRLSRGVEVITWGSHDELTPFATHPPELEQRIRAQFGAHHPMGDEIPVRKTHRELEKIRRNLVKGARLKGELAKSLAAQPWDFFLAVFGETHRGGHILWPSEPGASFSALLDVYQAVDSAVGDLLQVIPNEAKVYLFALHGMGPNTSQEHFAARILKLANRSFTGQQNGSPEKARRGSLVPWLREHLPTSLQNVIAHAVPVRVRDEVVNRSVIDGHDWNHTPGLSILADANAYVRWNLAGRERNGLLDPDGDVLLRYREHVERCFRGFRLDSGEPLVRELLFSNRDFPGQRSEYLPDMIVTWRGAPPATSAHSQEFGTLHAEMATGRGGNHRPDGFCVEVRAGVNRAATADAIPIWELGELACRELLVPAGVNA
jgi:predicted AlkP superfamily phosphohydrolase/phosphomutase